jgi:Putative peptidoglycan binding domain/N-acetylmuramoyl-L-alanine amidase
MSLIRVPMPSPCYSSRGGSGVRLVVIHTAEGSRTIESLGNFFANGANEVSSHAGADDKSNTVGIYVERPNKAWTAANYNPVAVQIELCAFAAWSTAEWDQHPNMLDNCAKWIAEECAAFGVPLKRLSASEAQGNGRGVCQHIDLGSGGGGHVDCGNGFPMDRVIQMAGGQPAPPQPQPSPPKPGESAPPFPYPASDYLGQPSPDPHCHSGFYGGVDTQNVRTWQQQMASRGWNIGVDGQYGPQSEDVCRQFQAEKGLGVDGLVGPQTWSMTWTAQVT